MAKTNGHSNGGSKKDYKALEQTLHEAFAYAQLGRSEAGVPKYTGEEEHKTPRGINWVGPKHYKTTVWWTPAEYVDLLRAREAMKFRGGLLMFIKHLAMELCPHVAPHLGPSPGQSASR